MKRLVWLSQQETAVVAGPRAQELLLDWDG